jgi:hypothetical protein
MMIDMTISADRNVTKKAAENKLMQDFMFRNRTFVEHEMYDYTCNNWCHRNSNKNLKKALKVTPGIHEYIHYKKSYSWNITYNTESTA